ncbi:MAG: hypothetical protein ABSF77_10315, partial [Spirochaetia bacterium]
TANEALGTATITIGTAVPSASMSVVGSTASYLWTGQTGNYANQNVSVAFTDVAGNPANSGTIYTFTIDNTPPTMDSFSFGSNTALNVIWIEGIYGSGGGALGVVGITIHNTGHSGAPKDLYPYSIAFTTSPLGGATSIDYTLVWNSGEDPEVGDTIIITPVADTVYDLAGNAATAAKTGTRSIALLNIMGSVTRPVAAAARSAVRSVGGFIQSTVSGTGPKQQEVAASPAKVSSAANDVARAPAPRTQFSTPLTGGGSAANASSTQASTVSSRDATPTASTTALAAGQAASATGVSAAAPANGNGAIAAAISAGPASAPPETNATLPVAGMTQSSDSSPPPPLWWLAGLGALAAAIVTAGAWFMLKFIRGRAGW